jgi:sugar/nucleoside kinase (ribokinase family)
MDIVVVGSVAYDSVTTPFGKAERALGGSASYFSTAANYFAPVKLVAVVGEDFEKEHLEYFRNRGIDTSGLEQKPGKTFFWEGEYGEALNEAKTHRTDLNVFADFTPVLPDSYRGAGALFLGNIDPALQREVMKQVDKPAFIAADTMNYWISGSRESLLETLKSVDILLINDSEAKMLAGQTNLVKAAKTIGSMGPKILVIKLGEFGAMLFEPGGAIFSAPALPLEELADPTGCGDTFAGGFVGYLAKCGSLDSDSLRKAVIYGSTLASFNVESFSLDRLASLTESDIAARYQQFVELVRFPEI